MITKNESKFFKIFNWKTSSSKNYLGEQNWWLSLLRNNFYPTRFLFGKYSINEIFYQERGLRKIQTSICSVVQVSRFTDLTFEIWTPRPLWIPEHRMHIKIPKFQLAHRGDLAPQSAQYLLSFYGVQKLYIYLYNA